MTEIESQLRSAGLTLVGTAGTADDVMRAVRPFISMSAVPNIRIPDTDDETSIAAVEQEFSQTAESLGLFTPEGEFLITIAGPGASTEPWKRVRVSDELRIRDLGRGPGDPEFVASSLDGSVKISVSSEEDGYWILHEPA